MYVVAALLPELFGALVQPNLEIVVTDQPVAEVRAIHSEAPAEPPVQLSDTDRAGALRFAMGCTDHAAQALANVPSRVLVVDVTLQQIVEQLPGCPGVRRMLVVELLAAERPPGDVCRSVRHVLNRVRESAKTLCFESLKRGAGFEPAIFGL
jgi:hypothetical protein